MSRVWGLDFLRAVAVLGVLVSHITPQTNEKFLQTMLPIGPILGVELFFVLSGFLIGQLLIKTYVSGNFGLGEVSHFMKRRWYRTLPNFYLFFGVFLFIQPAATQEQIIKTFFFLQNALGKPEHGFYGVAWSLSIEEIFYLSFPLFLLAVSKLRLTKDVTLLLTIFSFILIPFLLRIFVYNEPSYVPEDYRKTVAIRLDSIAYGVLAAYIKLRHVKLWQAVQRQGAFLLIPFWYFILFNRFPVLKLANWADVFYPLCSLTMAIMLPYFDSLKENRSIFASPIRFLALISYSLYLCHVPVIVMSNRYLGIKSLLSGHFLEAYYIFTSILVAYLTYRFWEKPMTDLRDRRRSSVKPSP